MRIFSGLDELRATRGPVGVGDWVTVDQARIDRFADATDDRQWIHVDPQRAADGPFGGTIAHGLLTLSLVPDLVGRVFALSGQRVGVNYGFNRVRFTTPVPAGGRVRARVELADVADVAPDGVQLTLGVTVELEGADRPALVAEWVVRRYV